MLNYWRLAGQKLLLLGFLPLAVGVLIAGFGWQQKGALASFVENLRQTDGRVLRLEPDGDSLSLLVEYLDLDGVRYEKSFRAERREESVLRAIGKVTLVHDRHNPRHAQLGHIVSVNNSLAIYWAVFAAGALLSLGGLAIIAAHFARTLRTLRLFRSGTVVQTEVRDNAPAPGARAGRFTYAFRGSNGRWFDGKSPELPAGELANWPPGRPLIAVYDPADPRISEPDLYGIAANRRTDATTRTPATSKTRSSSSSPRG
jgi:hypothetical protein